MYDSFADELEQLARPGLGSSPRPAEAARLLPLLSEKTAAAWTAARVRELATKAGLDPDSDSFRRISRRATKKERLEDMTPGELRLLAAVLVVRGKRMAARSKRPL